MALKSPILSESTPPWAMRMRPVRVFRSGQRWWWWGVRVCSRPIPSDIGDALSSDKLGYGQVGIIMNGTAWLSKQPESGAATCLKEAWTYSLDVQPSNTHLW